MHSPENATGLRVSETRRHKVKYESKRREGEEQNLPPQAEIKKDI